MKIAIVINTLGYRGGERVMITIAEWLYKKGHDVKVFTIRKEKKAILVPKNLSIVYSERFNSLLQNNVFYMLFGWIVLYFLMKKEVYDVDWVISEYGPSLTASYFTCKNKNIRLVNFVHAFDPNLKNTIRNILFSLLQFGFIEKKITAYTAFILTVSQDAKAFYEQQYKKKAFLIKPIIYFENTFPDENIAASLKKLFINNRVLFFPGALSVFKNQEVAVRTLALLLNENVNFILVFAGDGNYKSHLEKAAKQLSVTNKIYFLDVISRQTAAFCYKHAYLTLQCSIFKEAAIPLTILESLYFGTPVLISSCLTASRIIKEKKLGYVSDNTPESYTNAIKHIFNNYSVSKKKAEQGQTFVMQEYNAEKNIEQLIEILRVN